MMVKVVDKQFVSVKACQILPAFTSVTVSIFTVSAFVFPTLSPNIYIYIYMGPGVA